MNSLIKALEQRLSGWPEPVLTFSLLFAAGVLIYIALEPDAPLKKAVALAYVVLP